MEGMTKEREKTLRLFANAYSHFEELAKANGWKGVTYKRMAFAYVQGMVHGSDTATVDPVLWVALIRNDIKELNYINTLTK